LSIFSAILTEGAREGTVLSELATECQARQAERG
jgi:hypothetical protein